jgi:pyridoxine kinase
VAILSIQSAVVHGHVGNSAAQFALNRLGREVWAMPTVLLSNHPGHGGFAGRVTPAEELAALLGGLMARGFLNHAEAVLSGYLGSAENGLVLREAVARVKRAKPQAPWLLDPVMGDVHTGVYVKPDLVPFFRAAAAEADIVTPNRFELGLLLDRPTPETRTDLRAAVDALAGPRIVAVTSALVEDGRIATLLRTPDGCWLAWTPHIAKAPHGSGDLFAALFLAHLLDRSPLTAIERALAAVADVLQASAGQLEMSLIAQQDRLTAPGSHVEIEALG